MHLTKKTNRLSTEFDGATVGRSNSTHKCSSIIDSRKTLPHNVRVRLNELFSQIVHEFEMVYAENLSLHRELELTAERSDREITASDKYCDDLDVLNSKTKTKAVKLKPSANKLKQQTSRLVSSFKTHSAVCTQARVFHGHRDGVWHVSCANSAQNIIVSASADNTARVWCTETGRCQLQYTGHEGSVNSAKYHPNQDLVLTASGDGTAHLWHAAVTDLDTDKQVGGIEENVASDSMTAYLQDTSLVPSISVASTSSIAAVGSVGGTCAASMGGAGGVPLESRDCLRTPIAQFNSHSSVVIFADWLASGDQIVTASWDRSALMCDVSTCKCVCTLSGHDAQLCHVCTHCSSNQLVITSSRDCTFRLWDLRDSVTCVSVFQAHSQTVTSTVFTDQEDKIVSSSDDRTCKVWDLRHMRAPLVTVRTDSSVNILDVSPTNVYVAAPCSNRHVRVFDLQGQRLARLPRSNTIGHQRMVTSVAWNSMKPDDMTTNHVPNLFTSGFDHTVIGWQFASTVTT